MRRVFAVMMVIGLLVSSAGCIWLVGDGDGHGRGGRGGDHGGRHGGDGGGRGGGSGRH